MKIQSAWLFTVLFALLAGSAQADTYYFTGTITDDYLWDQPALPVGTAISGTFTISLANAQTVTGLSAQQIGRHRNLVEPLVCQAHLPRY